MKKLFACALALSSLASYSAAPELPELSKSDLQRVSNEFAMNFSHTAVAAPETEDLWGVEVGVIGGSTGSPRLKKLINEAGEDGSDFKNIYHAGLMARAHFPYDIFLEASILPEREISDVEVAASSLAIGWNFGQYLAWPLDLAIGANFSQSDIEFDQVINNASTSNTNVNAKVSLDSVTKVYWVGASKRLAFITPYVKMGIARSESDVKVDTNGGNGTIFAFSGNQKEDVDTNGGYFALGANLQLFFFRFGFEASQTARVKRGSAKLSVAF